MMSLSFTDLFFFFNDTATTEIYTLSLHDALPILRGARALHRALGQQRHGLGAGGGDLDLRRRGRARADRRRRRSEEHTSELQSRQYLVCRLLLEKKKNNKEEQLNFHKLNYNMIYL